MQIIYDTNKEIVKNGENKSFILPVGKYAWNLGLCQ